MGKTCLNTNTSGINNAASIRMIWLKRFLNLFLVYHLTAILVAPNLDHYLAQKLKPFFMPYWNLMEFGSQWNFFAPEPGPAPIFLRYEVYGKNGELITEDQMPKFPDDYFFRDRQIRRLNIVRYLMRDDQKVYSLFVPWLCRTFPDAEYIKLKKRMMKLPTVIEIQNKERTFADDRDTQEWKLSDVSCDGRRE